LPYSQAQPEDYTNLENTSGWLSIKNRIWRPQGNSNPCSRLEGPVSWATRRWGH